MVNLMIQRLLAVVLLLVLLAPAFAHSRIDATDPADGAVLDSPPEAVILNLTEQPELALSRVTVTDAAGQVIATGAPVAEDETTLRVDLPVLGPGLYRVDWAVTSVDTHSTGGSFSFTVK